MATKQFGDKGQYTYNVDSKGIPYGAPIATATPTPTPTTTKSTSTPKTNTQTGGESSDFMSAIQAQLLGQSKMISSTNSQLTERINNAIAGVNKSTELGSAALESQKQRELGFASEQGALGIQNQLEGRSGFATQMVAFRNLVETTDKNIKDLDQRYNELIMQNDAAGAAKVADLQYKAIEFQQQAQQQVFSNLLGMANFGLQSQQEARLAKQQTFQEQQATASIALEYGLDPTGKTLDQITKEAMIYASDDRKAELAQQAADLAYTKAQTAKVLTGDKKAVIDDSVIGNLATQWNKLKGQGFSVESNSEMQNILGVFSNSPENLNKFYAAVANDAVNSAEQSVTTLQTQKAKVSGNLPTLGGNFSSDVVGGFLNTVGTVSEFITGTTTKNYYNPLTRRFEPNPNYKKRK